MIKCSKCKTSKEDIEFYSNKKRKNLKDNICKECRKSYNTKKVIENGQH